MNRSPSYDSKARVARHRAAMWARGYPLKQFWLPDVRTSAFKAQALRDARLIVTSAACGDDLGFAAAVQHWPEQYD